MVKPETRTMTGGSSCAGSGRGGYAVTPSGCCYGNGCLHAGKARVAGRPPRISIPAVHVALYFPRRLPVQGPGGTQRVVLWLAQGLAELGHTVSLLALRGTQCRHARVVPLEPSALEGSAFDLTRYMPDSADLLHSHVPLARPPRVPHLFTWHGNARAGEVLPPNVVFLSADHAHRHGRDAFVYNGLDLSDYRFERAKEDYHLFIGRLH